MLHSNTFWKQMSTNIKRNFTTTEIQIYFKVNNLLTTKYSLNIL